MNTPYIWLYIIVIPLLILDGIYCGDIDLLKKRHWFSQVPQWVRYLLIGCIYLFSIVVWQIIKVYPLHLPANMSSFSVLWGVWGLPFVISFNISLSRSIRQIKEEKEEK